MKIKLTKAPAFTKAIIAAAIFTIAYLASTSNLPSCSDAVAVLNSGGACIERQSFLHTGSGFCATCGIRIIAGDRFCQGCGVSAGSLS